MIELLVLCSIYGVTLGIALGRLINWSIGMWNVYTAGPYKEMWVPVRES